MRLHTCDTTVAVVGRRRESEVRILGWWVITLGLALGAILAFSIGQVAECSLAGDAQSSEAANAAVLTSTQSGLEESAHSHSVVGKSTPSAPARMKSAVGQCYYGSGHKQKGAASKIYASSTRDIDQVSAANEFGGIDWPVAAGLFLIGRWRGPLSFVSRSYPSGRHMLLSKSVTRT